MLTFGEELASLTRRIEAHQVNVRKFGVDLADHVKKVSDLGSRIHKFVEEKAAIQYW